MTHITFNLAGEDMQIFDIFPFVIVTDCDGTELVYIRRQIHDDSKCDIIYVAGCIYQYANWTIDALKSFCRNYVTAELGRDVASEQSTSHLVLPQIEISDFSYGVNCLSKLRG